MYHEVVKTTKEYMQCVTAIEPEWLGEYGSKYFYLRRSHMDAQRERERDRETQMLLDEQKEGHEKEKHQEIPSDQKVANTTLFVPRKSAKPSANRTVIVSESPEEDDEEEEATAAALRRQRMKDKKRLAN